MRKTTLILLLLFSALLLCSCGRGAGDDTEKFAFGVVSLDNRGNAFSEATHGYYPAGTAITAHAVPADGYAFYCWTEGALLEDGGRIVSYRKDYSFSLTRELWLYPNYRDHDRARVLYHANGGVSLTAGETGDPAYLWDDFSLDYYLYPNALPDIGCFEREGYTLIGYNTAQDGSGEFYTPGGKIFEDTDAVIELWCVWSEQSPADDFVFSRDGQSGGWIVSAYQGPGGDVSIPAQYDGGPVVGVAAGAFAGRSDVGSIVFPSSIRTIEDGSCSDMTGLTTITLFDSLDYVADASFSGDVSLDTVYICAATNPHYSDWFNNHSKKIELMNYWKDDDRPMMVILGGSSVAYAVDAQQLQSLLDRDYIVLNCGTNGANIFSMACGWAAHFLEEGDFLLQILEYSSWQMGGNECAWETFRSFEGCYNVFSWVRISQFEAFFDSFREYLDARKAMPDESYEDYVSNMAGTTGYFDLQGTLTVQTRGNGSEDFWQGRTIHFRGNWLHQHMVDRMNLQFSLLSDMGVDYALAFTPLNRNALNAEQTDEEMEDFESYLAENLNAAIISDLQENIMDPAVFYDDDYHLASPARAVYTERLAGDLNELFASQSES